MMKKYILAIDQGTTGSTAIIADEKSLKVISKVNHEFKQIFPKPSWVEHSLDDIFQSVKDTIAKAISEAKIESSQIVSIGITNQRETTCAFTKSGDALHNAIVWQDRRTGDYCKQNQDAYEKLKIKTGLPLDPYFSATKMKWLLDNSKDVQTAYKKNDLCFSTIDTYLLYKLTSGESFKTDASNASRTLLMDLKTCEWDKELLCFFDIDSKLLPTIEDSFCDFGKTQGLDFLPDGIKINCILGDQQAALFGQTCIEKNDIKCTYGTGAFILTNTGKDIIQSRNGLLTTVAYKYKDSPVYALEGSSYIAGAAVQWLRDNLNMIKEAKDVESLAKKSSTTETEDVFFFPFFTGVGAPYWKSEVKASIEGITRSTGSAEIARVCLEGIAQSVCDSISAIEKDLGLKLSEIRVDGGASLNNLLMQMQANFSDSKILRPQIVETTGYGVILGSAMQNGSLKFSELKKEFELDKEFVNENDSYYCEKRKKWIKSVESFN